VSSIDLGIRYYIAVPTFDEEGRRVLDFVEEFLTEQEARNKLPFYLLTHPSADVIPVKFVTEYGTPLEPDIRQ
jgi:hypothetical protein